ncbi:terminase [Staphylococcus schleiferi]|uniref:phage tail protein n=1 Tax=Staphylococcus coagulans TaxID=74706 RepID=UPI00067A2CF3|nr:terminase [Staphylococcus schleiferi]AKS74156.1 terminase [Staphylococcus schleiferi]
MGDRNFVARIMAEIQDFQRKVSKAQRLAKTSVPDEIQTEINANISKFQRNLQRAKAMAQKWREHRVDIDGDSSPIKRVITFVKAKLNELREKRVKIDGNNNSLKRAVTQSKLMLATLFDKTVKVNFKTDGLSRAQILTRALGASLEDYGNKMDALATKIRTFGTIFGQQIKGVMIASVQALIPVIAGLVPALFAVLNAVGVLGGGVIGLAGAFSVAGLGAVAFGAMAISAIKMFNDGLIQSTDATDAYEKSLEGLKNTWSDIIKLNADSIFGAMSSGLNGLQTALKNLTPFLSGVSMLVDANAQQFEKWVAKSNTAKKAFEALNSVGVQIFADLLNAAGRFGDGLVNIFTQFFPLFKFMSQGLQNMSIDFQNWANSVAGQNAIKSFIEYTKTNLPKIGQIFGNVFRGIGNLMIAFGQNSAGIFDWLVQMTNKFREWSETVGKSEGFKKFVEYVQQNGPIIIDLIGNVVNALIAFGTAMAPIASKLLQLITAFAGWVAQLFETHPAVAKVIGVALILGGALWALMAPIIAVGAVLSNVFGLSLLDVGSKIIGLVKNSSLLTTALNVLKNPFKLLGTLGGLIVDSFGTIAAAFTSISAPVLILVGVIAGLVAVIVHLWKTNENFRKIITDAWNGVKDAIGGAVESVINWLGQLWAKSQETIQPIMPILQILGQVFTQVLGVVVMGAIVSLMGVVQLLWTNLSVAFTAIGTIISVAVQLIVGLFTALIQFLTGDFSGAWQTIKDTIANVGQTIWSGIQSIWNQIAGFLTSVMNRILGMFGVTWQQAWTTITRFVTQIWNSVLTWFTKVAVTVLAKMIQAYNYIISKGTAWVSSIWNTMVNFVAKIVSGFINVVSEIGSGMQRGYNKITSFFGDFLSAGAELISRVAEGVASAAYKVVSAVGDAISNAWSAVTSFIGGHGGGRGGGVAVGYAKDIASQAGRAFNTELNSTLTEGLGGSLSTNVDRHMTSDVRHSMQENNRPVVNVMVKNESDLSAIKSYIDEVNGKDAAFSVF